jgi:ABC-type Fe3+-siderophore transport system permease subunit
MVQDNVEKKILSLAALCCALVLLACATQVRMPLSIIDAVLGVVALIYAFRKMRVRRRRQRYMPYTRF